MQTVIIDAFVDSAKMVPLLLIIYIGIEFFEYKFGNKLKNIVEKAGNSGPAIGSLAGSLPQCGFSVITTVLYNQRLVTIGTLIAVYLATSDEAIPIILSRPDKVWLIFPIILTKIVIAVFFGYLIDFIFKNKNKSIVEHIINYKKGEDDTNHNHNTVLDEKACCGHHFNDEAQKINYKKVFIHPIIHTIKIFSFIFAVSLLINFVIYKIGIPSFNSFFIGMGYLQPIFSALIGLIPNCASSVAVTQLYLDGAISYGSVIAGLCASGGLGILVLFREEKNKIEAIRVISILFVISAIVGIVIQLF